MGGEGEQLVQVRIKWRVSLSAVLNVSFLFREPVNQILDFG